MAASALPGSRATRGRRKFGAQQATHPPERRVRSPAAPSAPRSGTPPPAAPVPRLRCRPVVGVHRLRAVHPQGVIQVVGTAITGIGVDQDGQAQAVELQPGHQHRQQVVGEAEIERRGDVWSAWLQVPVAQLHREALGRPAPQQRSLLEAVLVEVDMRVIALDVGVGAWGRGQGGFAGTHAGRAQGRFAGCGLAPGAAPFRRWRHDDTEAGAARLGGIHRVVAARCCGAGRRTGQATGGQTRRSDQAAPCRREQVGPVGVIIAGVDEGLRVRLHEGLRGGTGVDNHVRSGRAAGGVQ